MDDKKNFGRENQGEGNKTADKNYREGATGFAQKNDTVKAGLDAGRDVENYRDEYDKAEREGRRHSAGDLPGDLKGRNDGKK